MKRDMSLIRQILMQVEQASTGWPLQIAIEGYSEGQIGYHCYLIVDAGLAKGVNLTTMDDADPNWRLLQLTWAGHEFVDAARDESRWKEAMRMVTQKGGSIAFAVLTQLLTQHAKGSFGLS